ncbi:hypothetical protein [Acidovorax sp. IB03]|uniref:hypothetical protein n=1 Tax=Acidovorax sp. IB03 TaxID=2779366 RepID=UPI001E29534E|nr:hypothetical protein [Acidovorax sp. IB03]
MGCSEKVSAEVSSNMRKVDFSTLHSMPGRQFFRMALPAGDWFLTAYPTKSPDSGLTEKSAEWVAPFSSNPSTVSALIVVLSRVASVATVRVRGCLKDI